MQEINGLFQTPFGSIEGVITEAGVCRLFFTRACAEQEKRSEFSNAISTSPGEHPLLRQLQKELLEYCYGTRRLFSLPLHLQGTAFQKAVWQRLTSIPYGRTASYKEIADQLNLKNGSRAVGRAVAQNPILILVPCHRVVGISGRLTGFAAGLDLKERLLELEGIRIPFGRSSVTS